MQVGLRYGFQKALVLKNIGDHHVHIPAIDSIKGLAQLLSLCNFVILGNVLDFRTYSAPNQAQNAKKSVCQEDLWWNFDRNQIPAAERRSICYARGMALGILEAIDAHCSIFSTNGSADAKVDNLPWRLLADQMRTIVQYKREALEKTHEGVPHCTLTTVQHQMRAVASLEQTLQRAYEDTAAPVSRTLLWSTENHRVVWTKDPKLAFSGKF